MGYLLEKCLFDRLTSEVINQCLPYICTKDADIDSFFHSGNKDNFEDYAEEMMSTSHCFYTDEESPKMVCAFSLASSSVLTAPLPKNLRNRLNRHIPNSKRRSQYPAILISQLCIFDGFGQKAFGHNIGDEMMDLIKAMVVNPENDNASRYLIVDAINTPEVIGYYKRNGFKFLFEEEAEELHYLRGDVEHENAEKCRTRLMLFDLILLKK